MALCILYKYTRYISIYADMPASVDKVNTINTVDMHNRHLLKNSWTFGVASKEKQSTEDFPGRRSSIIKSNDVFQVNDRCTGDLLQFSAPRQGNPQGAWLYACFSFTRHTLTEIANDPLIIRERIKSWSADPWPRRNLRRCWFAFSGKACVKISERRV